MSMASIRAKARQQVHKVFSVQVLYTPVGNPSTPLTITARINTQDKPTDTGQFGNVGYATRTEQTESLIFNAQDVQPQYGDVVITVDTGIEYRIETAYPEYGGYIECEVTRK